jgi:citronellol/citronellal dehydrogenase
MTLCALGFAAEFADDGIASNTLWPRTLIATAAVQNLLGGDEAMARARQEGGAVFPEIGQEQLPT